MAVPQEIHDFVQNDIMDGFNGFVAHSDERGDGFSIPDAFIESDPMTNGIQTAVVWEYRCRHADWWNGVPPPSDESEPLVVTIRGTTIIDQSNDPVEFRRYIDWLGFYSDLGY